MSCPQIILSITSETMFGDTNHFIVNLKHRMLALGMTMRICITKNHFDEAPGTAFNPQWTVKEVSVYLGQAS